jgi:hypothetical protein
MQGRFFIGTVTIRNSGHSHPLAKKGGNMYIGYAVHLPD